jgi:hypothetical protein
MSNLTHPQKSARLEDSNTIIIKFVSRVWGLQIWIIKHLFSTHMSCKAWNFEAQLKKKKKKKIQMQFNL